MLDFVRLQSAPELQQRGVIIVLVIGLHVAVVAGMLIVRIVEHVEAPGALHTVVTYIPLQPLPVRGPRKRRSRGGATAPGIYFDPYAPFGVRHFALHISPYKGSLAPPCHYILAPSSDEFKQHCMGQAPPADEAEDFSLFPGNPAALARWKAQMKKRDAPYQLPCTYVRTDPETGLKSNMTDIGCTAKSLFGGN